MEPLKMLIIGELCPKLIPLNLMTDPVILHELPQPIHMLLLLNLGLLLFLIQQLIHIQLIHILSFCLVESPPPGIRCELRDHLVHLTIGGQFFVFY
jgi:hypothetical protein